MAASLASAMRVAPLAPGTTPCIDPEMSMTASIRDGSLVTWTLLIASPIVAASGSGAVVR